MIDGEVEAVEPLDELPVDEPEAVEVEAVEPEADEDDDGEIEISFDGEEPIIAEAKPADNSLIRDFRKRNRELAAENARLRAQHEASPLVLTDEVVGPVPTLESCDWDENRLADAMEARARKAIEIDRNRAAREEAAAKQAAADAEELASYVKARAALGARDYEDAEAAFVEAVPNVAYQRLIVRASDNPAAVIYALYRSPAKLAELAAITDAAKLAAAIGKMEARLKVVKKSTVQAERRVTGAAPVSGTAKGSYEANLEKLRAKAEVTGDLTPVLEYKRKHAASVAR